MEILVQFNCFLFNKPHQTTSLLLNLLLKKIINYANQINDCKIVYELLFMFIFNVLFTRKISFSVSSK